MNQAGWYPDPGGAPGMYRYWNGSAWTTAVTDNPLAASGTPTPQPAQPAPQPAASEPIRGSQYPSGNYGQVRGIDPYNVNPYPDYYAQPQTSKKWWIVLVAVVLVLGVGIWYVTSNIGNWWGGGGSGEVQPSGTASANACPKIPEGDNAPVPREEANRVYGGLMSYEKLGDPWSSVQYENRVAYSYMVGSQTVMDQENYDPDVPGSAWVASVVIGELAIGDGFASPEQGAELLFRCLQGEFYGDNELTVEILESSATTISGHNGWMIDSTFHFDIEGLNATSERVKIILVQTTTSGWSIFYSSVPNTSSYLDPDVDKAIASLTVDG
ncbi:MAG: DUF2510 domain-containing protein [Propionibacteriaceae bacterium]|jgi:hypothetical protein|nr:DUF2510 domain-containing protein [Propionibacteriaceae bacterium]